MPSRRAPSPPDSGSALLPPDPSSFANVPDFRSFMADGPLGANTHTSPVFQGPKRKRLIKACDACHKSKRRCDGKALCGNCYFAAKDCKYTDAAGRPVPAPNASRPGRAAKLAVEQTTAATDIGSLYTSSTSSSQPGGEAMPSLYAPHSLSGADIPPDSQAHTRKRHRWEDEDLGETPLIQDTLDSIDLQPAEDYPGLDHALIHELVNLFFAHCHPHRLIIHKTSFFGDLTSDRVPRFLLNVICALAAPLSLSPRLRASPPRTAGVPYAKLAHSLMLDKAGHLRPGSTTLATAQALVLLQMHELALSNQCEPTTQYSTIAMRVLQDLGLQTSDNPILTPVPSVEFRRSMMLRECIRRTFWMNQLITQLAATLSGKPRGILIPALERSIRLPCDETNFEMSTAGGLPEYMMMTPVQASYASQFGHLLRISRILYKLELLHVGRPDGDSEFSTIMACEEKLQDWVRNLADHLKFSETTLKGQLNMWDTSYNTGAWCFFFMHTLHASCVMLLEDMKEQSPNASTASCLKHKWAEERMRRIIEAMGIRARNTVLRIVLWFYNCSPHANRKRVCNAHPEDPDKCFSGIQEDVLRWIKEHEDVWGPLESLYSQTRSHPDTKNRLDDYPFRGRADGPSRNIEYGLPMDVDRRLDRSNPPTSQTPLLLQSIGNLHIGNGGTSSRTESSSVSNKSLEHPLSGQDRPDHRRSSDITHNMPMDPESSRGGKNRHRDGRGPSLPSLKAVGLLDPSLIGMRMSDDWRYASGKFRSMAPPFEPSTASTVRPPQHPEHAYYASAHRYHEAQTHLLRSYQPPPQNINPLAMTTNSVPAPARLAWSAREATKG